MTQTSGPPLDGGALCVALDSTSPSRCLELAGAVAPHAAVLKVGLTSFVAGGPGLVAQIAALRPAFLDLKLHDIPAQVAGAVQAARGLGARYLTVHAAGGAAMVEAAVRAAGDLLCVLGVTVLTSLDEQGLRSTGVGSRAGDQVARLARLALDAGASGLVCSPEEVGALRERFGPRSAGGPLLVVPGVRDPAAANHDQRRVASPERARAEGADLVVIGRPITAASDPAAAAQRLSARLDNARPVRSGG